MAKPLISVIVASYLGHYKKCASHREAKFLRAIDSCLNNTFADYEIVIVSDGCNKTNELYREIYSNWYHIKLVELPKQPLWSGNVRNAGIEAASGEYITYLDTDDKLGVNHLQKIAAQVNGRDWIWYDDYLLNRRYEPVLNRCELKYGKCGTSNLTHKLSLGMKWRDSTYAHDWVFIQELLRHKNYCKTESTEYYICHQPDRIDL